MAEIELRSRKIIPGRSCSILPTRPRGIELEARNNFDRLGGSRLYRARVEGRYKERETYSVLKPLDFILCTLCRGDDLLGQAGGVKSGKGRKRRRGTQRKKRGPLGIF